MKKNKIIPIYKKGDKHDASNYRPIAITSALSKVYEKVFLTRLEHHLSNNNILIPEQHGFLKGKSTVTALFDFVTEVYGALEAKDKINVILYDFSNAFGTIYPPLLIKKLQYGLNGVALSWLESFLSNREQYVELREVDEQNFEKFITSQVLLSNMGVPQGTILPPLLFPTSFLVYLNDIKLVVMLAFLLFFADDSNAILRGKTHQDVNVKTESVTNKFIEFSETDHLKINANKTKVLQMHTYQTRNLVPPQIQINNVDVDIAVNGKLLGVQITDTMNWNEQCEKVANKLRSVTHLFTIFITIATGQNFGADSPDICAGALGWGWEQIEKNPQSTNRPCYRAQPGHPRGCLSL
jgi:hypothetical protein